MDYGSMKRNRATIQAKLSEGLSLTQTARDMRISRGPADTAKGLM